MNQLIEWAKGNPGALMFLMQLVKPENFANALVIVSKLENMQTIRGTNLYVLFSDLANANLDIVAYLCENCPPPILEDACSRQDYSGKELIKNYLPIND